MKAYTILTGAFRRHAELVSESKHLLPAVGAAAEMMRHAFKSGKKIYTCGNGGSAADSSHFVEELIGRYKKNRRPLPAVALTADGVVLTVIANDFGYEEIFSRQIEALGEKGDILVAFSTSGKSENILRAITAARKKKMKIVVLTGEKGKRLRGADVLITVPSIETARIQEMHELIYHAWCEFLDA